MNPSTVEAGLNQDKAVMESHSHRILWFGRDLPKLHNPTLLEEDRDILHQMRWLRALSKQPFNVFRDEASTTSLGNQFQGPHSKRVLPFILFISTLCPTELMP